GLEYRSLTLDICVVAVDVLSRDEEFAGFAFWRIGDRCAQFNRVDLGFAKRPRQQRLRKRGILWPVCLDLRERGARFVGATMIERVLKQPELAGEDARIDRP